MSVYFKSMNHLVMMRLIKELISRLTVPVFLACLLLFNGCDKFEGPQEIPAYIRIDSLTFSTDFPTEGTARHNLTDAWIYVDDQLIGGFELPLEVPVLQQGKSKIEIRAGIELNGISDTRAPYPCTRPYSIENLVLSPDSVTIISPEFEYYDNVVFVWREDFEDASLSIKRGNKSDTSIYRTEPANYPGAFLDEYSQYSGIAFLDDNNSTLELESDNGDGEGFVINRGDFVFLELHFKTTVPLLVGMYIQRNLVGIEDRPYIILNNTDEWKKIYINFTPIVNEVSDAINFKVYFLASKSEGEDDHQIMLDNIKLITRPNL
jgi:hypothetical protein